MKQASMVLSRACPLCLTMVDPVCYGWHVTKCKSDRGKAACTAANTIKSENQTNNVDTFTAREQVHSVVPCTLNSSGDEGLQVVGGNGISDKPTRSEEANEDTLIHSKFEKQALADRVKVFERQLEEVRHQLYVENQAWASKVQCLELIVKNLESQLKKSEEVKMEALTLVESMQRSARNENGTDRKEESHHNCFLANVSPGLKTLSADNKSSNFVNDNQRDEASEQNEFSVNEKEKARKYSTTESRGNCELNSLTCAGKPLSEDSASKVDCFIENEKSVALVRNLGSMQGGSEQNLLAKVETPICSKNENLPLAKVEIPACSKNENLPLAICYNGSPSTVVLDQEDHTLPRDLSIHLCDENSSLNKFPEDLLEVGKPNEGSDVLIDSSNNADTQEAAADGPGMDLGANKRNDFLCKDQTYLTKARLHSGSSSSESEINVFKAKTGHRRLLLSNSDSEDAICQQISIGMQEGMCKSKGTIVAGDSLTENCREDRISEPYLPRLEQQPKVIRSSNDVDSNMKRGSSRRGMAECYEAKVIRSSNDVASNMKRGSSRRRMAECYEASATNLEERGTKGLGQANISAVRRSKRLRMLSDSKLHSKNRHEASSNKNFQSRVVAHSSSTEMTSSIQGSEESNTEASSKTHSSVVRSVLREHQRRKPSRQMDVFSSISTGTSSHDERLTLKRCSRVCKRLFTDVESKPAHGENAMTESEADESESYDSLKNFITDSEGEEVSQSSNETESWGASHSSREVYCNPRLRREINVRHYVWEMEPEMLSAFAVNPELCLRAVCAINRRQTEDEQTEKLSKYANRRGFNVLHAKRGTRIAEFLTDGDPNGPVKKSVEDLKTYDVGGLEFCKMIATMHSKQLFDIYTNAEDPHFPFS